MSLPTQGPAASPAASMWLLALIALTGLLLTVLTPPFQSPDEFDHIKRAYLLSKRQVLLTAPPGEGSGGAVDTGLLTYMNVFWALPFKPERKVTAEIRRDAAAQQWTEDRRFSAAPGTGYYLPLAYLPQALTLGVTRRAGLSIDTSYRATRVVSLLVALSLVAFAMRLYPMPPAVIGLLALPMTLFQMSAASLDGVTYALALLALACYLHSSRARDATRTAVLVTFSVAVFVLVTCRVHLMPMVLLFPVLWHMTGRRWLFGAGAAVLLLALAWTLLAMHLTVDPRVVTGASARTVLLHYLGDPGAVLALVIHTVSLPQYHDAYLFSFLGKLGWLDTEFASWQYAVLGWSLVLLLLASLGPVWRWPRREIAWRLLLLACSLVCVLLVFLALLITWNRHPAQLIEGVQGRYFWVPALMACLALSPPVAARGRLVQGALIGLQIGFIMFCAFSTVALLLNRYWAS